MSSGAHTPVRQRQVLAGRPHVFVSPPGAGARRRRTPASLADAEPARSQQPGADPQPFSRTETRSLSRRPKGARSAPSPARSASSPHASPLRPDSELQVVRRATRDDVVTRLKHQQREQEAQRICLMKIRERGLAMKLARVEQLFDGSRLIFYYTAEGRVDFRELVRDLAAHFRVRIEMRQIGVRDEARMLGGYGSCGRPLCCTTFLQTFEPISIKMAKQQNLSLNPSKLSGMCGRLKCCLRYELPNGKGVKHGGCADEGGCGSCEQPDRPRRWRGCGACGPGGCGKCG